MPKSYKIAISLPKDLLTEIERQCAARGESRSQFLRMAVEEFLRRERQKEMEEQYIQGYLKYPETPEEVEGIYKASLAALAQEPWDDGEEQ